MSLTIQERIKDLRVEHGLTLKELAELSINFADSGNVGTQVRSHFMIEGYIFWD